MRYLPGAMSGGGHRRCLPMLTFRGGVHPPTHKNLVQDRPVCTMPLVQSYAVLVQQHLGAPARVIVKAGMPVKKGQVLTEPLGFVSVPVHAPTSGVIKEIGRKIHPVTGMPAPAVIIEADGRDEWLAGLPLARDPWRLSRAEFLDIIRAAGIVGMGGAMFPSHVKLAPPPEKTIDTLIVNGAECEPYLTADDRLMREEPARVVHGIEVVMHVLGLKRAFIGIEANKTAALRAIRASLPPEIAVAALKVKYPQGAEKQLIHALLRRMVPSGGLPMDVGVVVHNVGTMAAVWDACAHGLPLIERIVTVTGDGIREPGNVRVRIGTALEDLLEFCGGTMEAGKIICGGPMMGLAQYALDVPVLKGTSGVVVMRRTPDGRAGYAACIGCGRCVAACPMGLVPAVLSTYGEHGLWAKALSRGLMDCIECGCCAYCCPAHRPIVHFVKYLKARAREDKQRRSSP